MSYTIDKLEKNMARINITLTAEEIEAATEALYQRKKWYVTFDNYKPGEAPREAIEAKYGKEFISEDVEPFAVKATFRRAVKEGGLQVVAGPEFKRLTEDKREADGSIRAEAVVAVVPEIKLGTYKGIHIEMPTLPEDISDEEREMVHHSVMIEAIAAGSQMDFSDMHVKAEVERLVKQMRIQLQSQGMSFEDCIKQIGMTEEILKQQMEPDAWHELATRAILDAIVAAEKIEATEADIEAELDKLAQSHEVTADQLKEMLDPASRADMTYEICQRKAYAVIEENLQ